MNLVTDTPAPDATTPMVPFEQVIKRYGPLTVLDRLDLDIAANEKVAIIGPSGSGKTTVLRMLVTLETIDDGVIWVGGLRSPRAGNSSAWPLRGRWPCGPS